MKIVLVHNILWSHYTAKVFNELNKICLLNGHQLNVIQVALTMESRKNIGDLDYRFHEYPYQLLFDGSFEKTTWFDRTKAIYLALKNTNPDVLILSGYEDPAHWFMMIWAKMKGIKLAITADSTVTDRPRVWYKELFKKQILALPALIMCYGKAQKDYLQLLNVPENKIKIRIQATDNDKMRQIFQRLSKNKTRKYPKYNFLFVGRLIEEKNLFRLLDAFKTIESEDWGLVLVGDGHLETALKTHVKNQKISNVFFEGAKNIEQVIQNYKNHDVFILPSISETWGLVVNEAMLCEMPVLVSSHCGCVGDLVNGNGYIFNPLNTDDMAGKMRKILSNTDKFKGMGQKSLYIALPFTPEKSAQQMFEGIYLLQRNEITQPSTRGAEYL